MPGVCAPEPGLCRPACAHCKFLCLGSQTGQGKGAHSFEVHERDFYKVNKLFHSKWGCSFTRCPLKVHALSHFEGGDKSFFQGCNHGCGCMAAAAAYGLEVASATDCSAQ